MRSTEHPSYQNSSEQLNTYSTNDHSKFIDKVWDSYRFQINNFNSITAHQVKSYSSNSSSVSSQSQMKLPSSPFKNLKDALRQYMTFNQKTLQKLEESLLELSKLKDKDEKVKIINSLQEEIESYQRIFIQITEQQDSQSSASISNEMLQQIQDDLKQKEKQRQYDLSDAQLRLECQSKILAELMREQEQIKCEYQYNKTLLAQTQAQLKQNLGIGQNESYLLNTSGEINLGDSRLDTNLNNQEIENVVMFQQSTHNNSQGFQKQYLNNNQTASDYQGSPLPRDYLFKSTLNDQNNQQKLLQIQSENDSFRKRLDDFNQNYIRKDYLCQIVDKLQQTFQSIEFDASSLKDLISTINNQSLNQSMLDTLNNPQQYPSANQLIQQQLNDNFDLLSQRIQSSLAMNIQQSHNQNEVLDLKTEICNIKQKLLQAEQKRVEDINVKNMLIQKSETNLQEEQRRRIEEMDEKEKKIEELEKEIECTISQQMSENQDLRDKNSVQAVQLNKYRDIEQDILRYYSEIGFDVGFKQGDLIQMVQKLVKDNQNFKEDLQLKQESMSQLRSEQTDKIKEAELSFMEQKKQFEQDQAKIIKDISSSLNEQLKQKDKEIFQLKNKMSNQIDQISLTLDDNLAQNQELHQQIINMKQEISNKEIKEKQLLAKIMKLRDDRSQYRQYQVKQNQSMLEQQEQINSIRDILELDQIQISNQFASIERKFDTNKVLQDQGQIIQKSLDEISQALIEIKKVKARKIITRNQSIQVNFEQEQKPQQVQNQSQDHSIYYEEIIRLLRQQQLNNKSDQDSETVQQISHKLEELHRTIQQRDLALMRSPLNKLNQMTTIECNNYHKLNQMETLNQDGTTPKAFKSRSFLQSSNSNNIKHSQQISSIQHNYPQNINVHQIYQELDIDENMNDLQNQNKSNNLINQTQLLMMQEGLENHEELGNSKFWFDMYQRIKKEISKERKQTLEAQSKLQDKEEEQYQLKQKLYLVQNENQTIEQLNSQYLQQIQELKSMLSLKDKNRQIQELTCIDQIIDELQSESKKLKGDYLQQVIRKISEIKDKYQNSDSFNQNVQENYMINASLEILSIFKALLNQLQTTQRELTQLKKSVNETFVQNSSRSPFRQNQQQQDSNLYCDNSYYKQQQINSQASTLQINEKEMQRNHHFRDKSNLENLNPHYVENNDLVNQKSNRNDSGFYAQQSERAHNNQMQNQTNITMTRHYSDNIPPKQSNRKVSQNGNSSHRKPQYPQSNCDRSNMSIVTSQPNYINLPLQNNNTSSNQSMNVVCGYQMGQPLTERQRLELYELRTAALRELEEAEIKGKEADPYLKKYVKSIDELLRKALSSINYQ
eukprot:403374280